MVSYHKILQQSQMSYAAPIINTVLASVATFGGLAATYGSLRYEDRNLDLFGPDDRPLIVDDPLMNSLQGYLYVFTHKAIWGSWLLLPPGGHAVRNMVNTVKELPPTEHWAFVARAECKAVYPHQVVYFVTQFSKGDFIQPTEEIGQNSENQKPFRALLQERNKAHAALSIVQSSSHSDVWIHSPEFLHKRYVYKAKQLRSPAFRKDEWVPMRKPMKLRELNDCIYDTKCTGKKYHLINNNCQEFSLDLFNKL